MKPTEIKNVITEILESRKEEGGIKALYFVGCGGSNGALYPAKTFMERECANIKSALINSNEFVYSTPKDLGKNVIVCLSCHKGNTPETINAAKLAKEKGAAVIILTWKEESEITPFGDYIINYTFGDNKDIAGEKIICALLVAVELLNQTEGYEHYEEFMDGVGRIDGIVKHACKHVEKRAELFAKEYKDDKIIYTMASGAGYGEAYMQRALKFLKTYAKRIEVIDAKDLGLSTFDASVVDYFNHSLFTNVYPVYNKALAEERQHPLTTRRYMWKVEY